jgi:hypothetical protein
MRGALARPRVYARIRLGGGPGRTFRARSLTELDGHHLAATALLTSMLVPFTEPVIVAFLPAC